MKLSEIKRPGLLKKLAESFGILKQNSNSYTENWGDVQIAGDYYPSLYSTLIELSKLLEEEDCGQLTIDIDEGGGFEQKNNTELVDLETDRTECERWKIIYSKRRGLNEEGSTEAIFFFADYSKFKESITSLNPLSQANPFHEFEKCFVFVNGLKDFFGNSCLQFLPLDSEPELDLQKQGWDSFPKEEEIRQSVYSHENLSWDDIYKFVPLHGNYNEPVAQSFLIKSAKVLSSCLPSSLLGDNRVNIRGIKNVNITFLSSTISYVDHSQVLELADLVLWCYSEKRSTRLKLLRDHLSLGIIEEKCFVKNCLELAKDQIEVCKEEYDFVISDLRTEYEAEKREFLTDLRNISSGYYERVRTMSSGLFRDVIAISFLLGINIGTELIKNPKIISTAYFSIFLYCIGGYLTISLIIQTTINFFEYQRLNTNTRAWAQHTRGYMCERKIDEYIEVFTKGARTFWKVSLGIWIAVYILLAAALFANSLYLPKVNDSNFLLKTKPMTRVLDSKSPKAGIQIKHGTNNIDKLQVESKKVDCNKSHNRREEATDESNR